jgi:stage V sporulation protein G
MAELTISNIEITPIRPKNGLVGFCSFVLNDSIYIGSVAIHNCLRNDLGYRLVYPTRKTLNGDLLATVYPINRTTGETIERAVIAKYKALVEDVLINE